MHSRPLIDLKPPPSEMSLEILDALLQTPKAIESKYLYDQRGSRLFELITQLPEYYLTRTEMKILRTHAADIARRIGAGRQLIEFGSGSSAKTRLLLEPLRPVGYIPVDISRQRLAASVVALHNEFEWLQIVPLCADYSRPFALPPAVVEGPRTAFFPGSSIGNFDESDAIDFLQVVHEVVGSDGQLLIGIDLKKDPATIEPAYDDAQGVTAAFTLNVLHHLNRIADADFDVDAFRHRARYNPDAGRVEIHVVSTRDQIVEVCGRRIRIRAAEAIHVENCYKYDVTEFDALANRGGFLRRAHWFDPKNWFAVLLYESA
jgi:dimethylhistidine N-methyltransferase